MGWIDKRPEDGTAQILEYAESGRLIDVPAPPRSRSRGPLTVTILAAAVVGAGFGLIAYGLATDHGQGAPLLGAALVVCGLGVLAPAARLTRETTIRAAIDVRPGAVLPPDLVRTGNWIHREGAWQRVDHIGRDGGGRIHALLSSGDVVELQTPVTVAGDGFRPVTDPVESLR